MTHRAPHHIALCLAAVVGVAGVRVARALSDETPPLTLNDCYDLALKRSEVIAIHQEQINETQGRLLQALSTVLPHVSFDLSEKRQDGSGGSAFTLREVPERKFTFSQPLFSGFKEFAALAGSRAERGQRVAEKRRAEQLLLIDVTDAFYLLLEQQEDLQALDASQQALQERARELEERKRLGRSRASEVVSAEAQLRRLEAELERVRSVRTTARQLLAFLTGLEQIDALADPLSTLPDLADEAHYVATAGGRADVRAAAEAWRVAKRATLVTASQFLPTVNLDGNYYTKRAGAAKDVDWDVTLSVDVPIFQGGQALGATQESAGRAREARLQFQRLRRAAELDIRETYAKLQSGMAQTAALDKARAAAEESYRLQADDYRLNLVNNLEVLQALQALQDARRDFIHAQHETKRLYWQLQVATGQTL